MCNQTPWPPIPSKDFPARHAKHIGCHVQNTGVEGCAPVRQPIGVEVGVGVKSIAASTWMRKLVLVAVPAVWCDTIPSLYYPP